MAACVWALTPALLAQVSPLVALAAQVGAGVLLYWAMLRVLMPAAARIIEGLVVALARRDFNAIRASIGVLAA
jgi:hypothetical protein